MPEGMTGLSVKFLEPQLPLQWEPELCEHQVFPANLQGPAEYCGNERDPDSDFCTDHNPDRAEPDWDSIGKDMRYGFDD